MKKYSQRIFAFLFILVFVFNTSGFLSPKPIALAFHCPAGQIHDPGVPFPPGAPPPPCIPDPNPPQPGVISDIVDGAMDAIDCALSPFDCALRNLVVWAAEMLLELSGLLAGLAGTILNGVVHYTVVNISDNYGNIPAIDTAWGTIRDLANMGFIFILLYAAIRTILGIGSDTRKLIVNVIIVAILINFSLFFTKIVIDAANILALFFYSAIAPGALSATTPFTNGISDSFMAHLQLQSLYNTEDISLSSIITIGIMGSILLFITAFVFFSITIMFIMRYVVLILVLILSPIAFMSFVLPALKGAGGKWLDALMGQAFFAPIYFAITWIALSVLGSISVAFGVGGDAEASLAGIVMTSGGTNVSSGALTLFLNFMIVIVFILASLTIAKSWANKAGKGVSGITKWAGGAAGAATFGLAARAGRYGLGAGAEAFSRTKNYKALESKSRDSMASRLALGLIDKTKRGSFDVRGTRLGGAAAGALGAGAAGGTGGFEAERKRYREILEQPGTESRKARQERARKAQGELDILGGVGAAAIPVTARTPAQQAAVDSMEKAIAKSTDKEIETIVDTNRNLLGEQEFANSISVKQLEAINKSDKFSEAEKDQLKNLRFGGMYTALAAGGPVSSAVRGQIKGLSDSELEMMDPVHLNNTHFVSQLRSSQVESINKGSKFTTSNKTSLRNTRRAPLLSAIATGNIVQTQSAIKDLGHKEVASLDMVKELTQPTMLESYTPELLKRMASEMSPADVQTLRDAIITRADSYTAPGSPAIPNTLNKTYVWLGSANNTFGT